MKMGTQLALDPRRGLAGELRRTTASRPARDNIRCVRAVFKCSGASARSVPF
jgi:hypothetical protein